MTDWSSRISEIKTQAGLKSADLARILGVRSGLISEIEQGRSKNPSAGFLELMVQKLKVNPDWLLTGVGPVFNHSKLLTVSNLPQDATHDKNVTSLTVREVSDINDPVERAVDDHVEAAEQLASRLQNTWGPKNGDPPILPLEKSPGPGAFRIPMLDQAVSAGGGASLSETDEVVGWVQVPKALRRYGTHLTALPVRGDSMEPTLTEDDMVVCDIGGWDGDGIYVLRMNDSSLVKRVSMRPGGYRVISDNKAYEPFDTDPERDKVSIVGRVRCILKVVG